MDFPQIDKYFFQSRGTVEIKSPGQAGGLTITADTIAFTAIIICSSFLELFSL